MIKSIGPLFVDRDEQDGLCLYDDAPTDLDLDCNIALDDVSLWEAYEAASSVYTTAREARYTAAWNVLNNLRKPAPTEVKNRILQTPTEDEIKTLALAYMKMCFRSRQKVNTAFRELAGISEACFESAWAGLTKVVQPVSQEMKDALHSKGWIYNVGDGCYWPTRDGIKQLEAAVAVCR
jgi:hypothetical protein